MKTLTVLTAAAALAMSMSVAGAQSSMQKPSAMQKESAVVGTESFCAKPRTGPGLNCSYASMQACEKVAQADGKTCVRNPKMTTGSGDSMSPTGAGNTMKKR